MTYLADENLSKKCQYSRAGQRKGNLWISGELGICLIILEEEIEGCEALALEEINKTGALHSATIFQNRYISGKGWGVFDHVSRRIF